MFSKFLQKTKYRQNKYFLHFYRNSRYRKFFVIVTVNVNNNQINFETIIAFKHDSFEELKYSIYQQNIFSSKISI